MASLKTPSRKITTIPLKMNMILVLICALIFFIPVRLGGSEDHVPGASRNHSRPVGALTGAAVFISPGHGWVWDRDRGWRTQRGVSHGLIEDHSNAEAVMQYLVPYLWQAGATVYTTRERCLNPNMIIVAPGSEQLHLEGQWCSENLDGTWNGRLYSHPAAVGQTTARAVYAPEIPAAGHYGVYLWYRPSTAGRTARDTSVIIRHSGGETVWQQDQNQGGYTWHYIGTYHFDQVACPEKAAVIIENIGTDPESRVVAGAVRFGGGMADTLRKGRTAARPRWEKSGRYYAEFSGFKPETDTRTFNSVSAMPMFAEWLMEPHEKGRSVYLSWHTNAADGRARGLFTFVYGPDRWGGPEKFTGYPGGLELATTVHRRIMAAVHADYDPDWFDGPIVTRWLGETNPRNNNRMPAALFEYGFHDNPEDAAYILDPVFRDTVARGTYAGIVDYFTAYVPGFDNNTILPERPRALSVRNIDGGRVELAWQEPLSNEDTHAALGDRANAYLVYQSPNGYGFDNGRKVSKCRAIISGLKPGETYYFRVTAVNPGGESFPSETLAVRIPEPTGGPRVLLVNGFYRLDREMNIFDGRSERGLLAGMNTFNYTVQYAAAAESRTGLTIDSAGSQAIGNATLNLLDYDAVLWIMGRETAGSFSLTPKLRQRLRAYLDSGGSLLITGTDVGTGLMAEDEGGKFLQHYLKAELIASDSACYAVIPAAEDTSRTMAAIHFDDGSGPLYHAKNPDLFKPVEGSHALLLYEDQNHPATTSGAAAIIYGRSYRLIMAGFPFETIIGASVRREAMANILDFLLSGD